MPKLFTLVFAVLCFSNQLSAQYDQTRKDVPAKDDYRLYDLSEVIPPNASVVNIESYSNGWFALLQVSNLRASSYRVLKLLRNGLVDPSYGNGGLSYAAIFEHEPQMKVMSDGRVVLAMPVFDYAVSSMIPVVYVLNNKGQFDTGFGDNGRLLLTQHVLDWAGEQFNRLEVIGTEIYLGLTSINNEQQQLDLKVVKITGNGVPDLKFGNAGVFTFRTTFHEGDEVQIENAGVESILGDNTGNLKISLRYTIYSPYQNITTTNKYILGLLKNGKTDEAFGKNGKVELPISGEIFMDPSGHLFVIDRSETFRIMKLSANGAIDTDYGVKTSDFTLDLPVGPEHSKISKAVEFDGHYFYIHKSADKLIKVDKDVNIVKTFGSNGALQLETGFNHCLLANKLMVLTPRTWNAFVYEAEHGKKRIVKKLKYSTGYTSAVMRVFDKWSNSYLFFATEGETSTIIRKYDVHGKQVRSFGQAGELKLSASVGRAILAKVAGDKLLVLTNTFKGGYLTSYSAKSGATLSSTSVELPHDHWLDGVSFLNNGSFIVSDEVHFYKFKKDGKYDRSFGTNGSLYTDINNVTFLPDGKYLQVTNGRLYRYLANGEPDLSSGIPSLNFSSELEEALQRNGMDVEVWNKLAVDKDQNVYILFEGTLDYLQSLHLILKIDPLGKIDSGFGENGFKKIYFGTGRQNAQVLVPTDDGLLYLAQSNYYGMQTYSIAKINRDGDLDAQFGDNGTYTEKRFYASIIPQKLYGYNQSVELLGSINNLGFTVTFKDRRREYLPPIVNKLIEKWRPLWDVLIYPNPSNTAFTFKFNADRAHQKFSVTVFNSSGMQVFNKQYQLAGYDLLGHNWKPGVYFVRIKSDGYEEMRTIIKR